MTIAPLFLVRLLFTRFRMVQFCVDTVVGRSVHMYFSLDVNRSAQSGDMSFQVNLRNVFFEDDPEVRVACKCRDKKSPYLKKIGCPCCCFTVSKLAHRSC